jgi:hypothetical protein
MQAMTRLERYYAEEVAATANRTFAQAIDPAMLWTYTIRAVTELFRSGTQVTAYVTELALRSVREALEQDRLASSRIVVLPMSSSAA